MDKLDELESLLSRATPGEWYQPDGANGHIWNNDAEAGEGYTPDRVIFEGPIQPQWAKDRKPDEWYSENENNLAATVAAVNWCRDEGIALARQSAEQAARVVALEKALEQICIDSNGDWKERRHDPQKALDDIHTIAVDAFYSRTGAA